MQQKLIPGATLDVVSREELETLLRQYRVREETRDRVREPSNVQLDATGFATLDVYTVPSGFEFEARRVFVDINTASESALSATSVNLGAAGNSLAYYRSGTRIQWALPASPVGGFRVPGLETWGREQGPYLRNGEIFQVRALLGAAVAGAILTVVLEGIQWRGGALK